MTECHGVGGARAPAVAVGVEEPWAADGAASVLPGSDETSPSGALLSQSAGIAADNSRSTQQQTRGEDIPATMQDDRGINCEMKATPYRRQDK